MEKQVKKKRAKICPEVCAGSSGIAETGGEIIHVIPKGDIRKVDGQNFLVLSYATPDGTTRVRSPRGMVLKFSGAFEDEDTAGGHAQDIRNEDPRFDVFVVEMYKWGMVPLPEDEKPFVTRKYADEMLTRIVAGLQNSMEQGKKEMEERKERDRAKAEEAMRRAKGDPDYKMPEKSDLLIKYEDEVKAQRAAAAAKEGQASSAKIMHSEEDVMNVLMQYCVENVGHVIDAGTGADLMKYFIEKSILHQAQMIQAKDREKPDEDPKNMPSREEVEKQMAERQAKPIDLTQKDETLPPTESEPPLPSEAPAAQ
ncbi:MAG: hypothetical protein P4L69_20805 [Desulfosporosinus sp.]|nr:hypothetical protein [Desulfosporosinus sp.]